jgi:PleD family two-component response regulator
VTSLLEGIEPEPALVTALCTADSALYAAKQAGRDRALLAPSATPPRRAATG